MKLDKAISISGTLILMFAATVNSGAHARDRGLRIGPMPESSPEAETTAKPPVSKPPVSKAPPPKPSNQSKTVSAPLKNTANTVKTSPKAPVSKSAQSKKSASTAKTAVNSRPAQKSNAAASVRPPVALQTTGKSKAFINASMNDSARQIIKVWLNKEGNLPHYRSGEKMQISVSATEECNVMIFGFDGRGKLTQLFPNEYQQTSLIRKGQVVTLGGSDSPFEYEVSVPRGVAKTRERIFVYAYPVDEAPITVALRREGSSPFRSGEITIDQYRKLVNDSKIYFAGGRKALKSGESPQKSAGREVKIVPKQAGGQSQTSQLAIVEDEISEPNKREISFVITGN